MTETIKSEFKCEFCDSNFSRAYNLKRHTERKHVAQNVNPVAQNVNLFAQNVNPVAQNVNLFQENKILNENQCIHCKKILANKWSLKRHNIKCTGVKDPHICNFCNKAFNSRVGKSKHIKICKVKNNALIVRAVDENSTQPLVTNNITNNNINTTNNINNGTINYNIIIYEDKKTKFLKDHMSNKTLRHILYNNTDETVFSKYNSELMERLENNCIRKSDKRSNYSQIHVGENKWKNIPDRKIYPEIISQIAEDMQDVVNDKFENLKSKEKLFDLLDYFIFKETSDDDKEAERRYKRIYNLVLEEQKLFAISAARNDNLKID